MAQLSRQLDESCWNNGNNREKNSFTCEQSPVDKNRNGEMAEKGQTPVRVIRAKEGKMGKERKTHLCNEDNASCEKKTASGTR